MIEKPVFTKEGLSADEEFATMMESLSFFLEVFDDGCCAVPLRYTSTILLYG